MTDTSDIEGELKHPIRLVIPRCEICGKDVIGYSFDGEFSRECSCTTQDLLSEFSTPGPGWVEDYPDDGKLYFSVGGKKS